MLFRSIAESVEYLGGMTQDKYPKVRQKSRQFGSFWGNGCGKTWFLVVLTGNIVWGPQNPWFDYRLFKEWPFAKHIRWVVDAPELKETGEIWRAINRWWPRHKFKESKDGYDYYSTFIFLDDAGNENGFTLSVRTNDQPLRLHESDDVGCVKIGRAHV